MYSKQEAVTLKQGFWTAFGQYMSPVQSADGEKIAWINYKTGEKAIAFKMNADTKEATIAIEIRHKSEQVRHLYFERLESLKELLHQYLGEEWIWLKDAYDEWEKPLSLVYYELTDVNILDKADWPAVISFFKPRMIALDEFWSGAKWSFTGLADGD
jgi:hypothetical protein